MVHRRLLALSGQLRGPLAAGVLIGWLVMAARVSQAALVGIVLGQIFADRPFGAVTGLLWVIAAVVLVRGVLVWAREVVAQAAAGRIKERVRDRLFSKLLRLGPGYLTTTRSGEVQATVVDGVEALEAYFSRYLPQLIVCLTGPVFLVAWMFTRDVWVGAVVLTGVLAVPLVPRLWDKLLAERGHEHWGAYQAFGADYLDSMQGMTTLKSLNAVDGRRKVMRERGEHLFGSTMRQMAVSMIDTGLTTFGVQLGVAMAVGVGAVRVANGDLDVTTLLILLVLTGECFRPFGELSGYWHAGFLGVSAAQGITTLLAAPELTLDPPDAVELPAQAPSTVAFDAVTYTYPGRTTPAVADSASRSRPGRLSQWSAGRVPARAPWSICCCASSHRRRGGS